MAQEDIYRVVVHFEGPTQPSSISLFYQENALSVAPPDPVSSLAFSFFFSIIPSMQNVINDQWNISSIRVRRLTGEKIAPDLQNLSGIAGGRSGAPLPANNCLLMKLSQSNFPRTSNGRLYFPGLSETDTKTGVILPDFLNGAVATLGNILASTLNENGGTGTWDPGVISAKVRDEGAGPPKWDDAFSPMIAAFGNPVIARQVRRTTKIIGVA